MQRKCAIVAAAIGVLLGTLASASAEPLKIRISWATAPGHLTPLLPLNTAIYKHYGKSYTIEPIQMDGSGPALQGIAAGEVDIGGLSAQALALGVARANLDLRVIAHHASTGVKGYMDLAYYMRKGEFKSVNDLKGKIAAVNARGSTVDAALRAMMGRHGLEDGRDYQIVEVRFSAMLATLESKRIDLALMVPPFNVMADKQGKLEPLFTVSDAIGPTSLLQYVARADWVAKNRPALVDFLEDHVRFLRWAHDPGNRKEAIDLVVKVTKRPPDVFEDWVFTTKGYYHDLEARVDVALLQKNIDDLVKFEVVPTSIDAAKHTDMSLVDEAVRRLGK